MKAAALAAALVIASVGCDRIPGFGKKKAAGSAEAGSSASATKEAPREFVVPERPPPKDMSSFSFEPAPRPSAGGIEEDRSFEPTPSPTVARTPGDYFGEGLATVVDKVKALRGTDLRAIEVSIFPAYIIMEMRDPKDAAKAVEVRLEQGVAKDDGAALLMPNEKSEAALATRTFDLTAVPWAKLPAILGEAPSKAGFPGRGVQHVNVHKFLPFDKAVMIRVYLAVEGGKSVYVVYDLSGTYVETVKG